MYDARMGGAGVGADLAASEGTRENAGDINLSATSSKCSHSLILQAYIIRMNLRFLSTQQRFDIKVVLDYYFDALPSFQKHQLLNPQIPSSHARHSDTVADVNTWKNQNVSVPTVPI